ncbi:MAG TPA: hypothetical protein VK997_11800 [Deferrisomatales bacterium]|nr:hypothetical protein [Deferrisomatales bacterium]
MTQSRTHKTALAFFDAYTDPGIEKRLYFDVWADRTGLSVGEKRPVWREIRRLTYRFAAEKRRVARQGNAGVRSSPVTAAEPQTLLATGPRASRRSDQPFPEMFRNQQTAAL